MWKKVERNVQMHHGSASCTTVVDTVVTDNGVSRVKTVPKRLDVQYKQLPDAENFSLEAQIKAGVKLEEVNTNLLSGELPVDLPIPNKPVEPEEPTEQTE